MKGNGQKQKLTAIAIWLGTLASFACWFEMSSWGEERQRALATAGAFFQEVVVSRQWNASHGGVYVPITAKTQPNKYLPVQNRDLTADNGLRLTKINPAYMTRQIAELARKSSQGIQIHITSLKPINPVNKATDLEARWLKSFERGVKEEGEFFEDGNITWFHYMAPLFVTKECLQCHVQQGYSEGDIRGGISISVPYPTHGHLSLFVGFGSVAVLGLMFIFIGGSLYERKQRLFDATFNSPMPVCVTGKDYTILMANESYWQTFGPLPDKQKSIKCHEHRPGILCHTEHCSLTMIMNGMSPSNYECTKELDGVVRHFIVTPKPLSDTKGKVIGCVESFQEITERRRMEEDLRKLSMVAEQSMVSVVITDLDGKIEYVNPKFCELTGYAREEAIGQNPRILQSDQTPPELYEELWATIISGKVWRGEFLNKKKNGDLYWEAASISSIKAADGTVTHYLAIKEDITERRRAEDNLQESEAMLARAQKIARLGSWNWNIQTGDIAWSDEVFRIFGLEPGELKPTYDSFMGFVHPQDRNIVQQAVSEAFGSPERTYSIEHCIVRPDGSTRVVSEVGECILGPDGKPQQLVGTVHDITERKVAEEERLNRQKLQSAIETAGAVCHELNQPLQVIMLHLDLTGHDSENQGKSERVEAMVKEIEKISAITAKLQSITKYETKEYIHEAKILDLDKSST